MTSRGQSLENYLRKENSLVVWGIEVITLPSYVGSPTLPSYVGILKKHDIDPY